MTQQEGQTKLLIAAMLVQENTRKRQMAINKKWINELAIFTMSCHIILKMSEVELSEAHDSSQTQVIK